MLKLKFSLDPKDAKQMLALSRFAATLADAEVITETAPLQKGRTLKDQAYEEAVGNTEPAEKPARPLYETKAEFSDRVEVARVEGPDPEEVAAEKANPVEPPKRKRRSKAEIEADEAAARGEAPKTARVSDGEEAESENAEVEDETEDAPAPKIEKKAGEPKRGSITLDDVRRAVAEKKGTPENFQKMKDRLKETYGVETTPKLDPKYYAEFYDFVNGLK